MPGTKISDLPSGTPATTDRVPYTDMSGTPTTRYSTLASIAALVISTITALSSVTVGVLYLSGLQPNELLYGAAGGSATSTPTATFTPATGVLATPNATFSGTATATQICLAGDACRTTWPTSGGGSGAGWTDTGSLVVLTTSTRPVEVYSSIRTPQVSATSTGTSISASGTAALTNVTAVNTTSTFASIGSITTSLLPAVANALNLGSVANYFVTTFTSIVDFPLQAVGIYSPGAARDGASGNRIAFIDYPGGTVLKQGQFGSIAVSTNYLDDSTWKVRADGSWAASSTGLVRQISFNQGNCADPEIKFTTGTTALGLSMADVDSFSVCALGIESFRFGLKGGGYVAIETVGGGILGQPVMNPITDPDNGPWFPGANIMGVQSNGADNMWWTTTSTITFHDFLPSLDATYRLGSAARRFSGLEVVNSTTTNATTTSMAATTVCIGGDCRTAWPVAGGAASTPWTDTGSIITLVTSTRPVEIYSSARMPSLFATSTGIAIAASGTTALTRLTADFSTTTNATATNLGVTNLIVTNVKNAVTFNSTITAQGNVTFGNGIGVLQGTGITWNAAGLYDIGTLASPGKDTYWRNMVSSTALTVSASSTMRDVIMNGTVTATGAVLYAPNLNALGATGDLLCQNNTTGYVEVQATNCTVSSIRFKEHVRSLDPKEMMDRVRKLRGVLFDYKSPSDIGPVGTQEDEGFIAEEVAMIDPFLVAWKAGTPEQIAEVRALYPFAILKVGEIEYIPQTVDYAKVSVLVTGAVQYMDERLVALEEKGIGKLGDGKLDPGDVMVGIAVFVMGLSLVIVLAIHAPDIYRRLKQK